MPPTPMTAFVNWSEGAMKPLPPRTLRGTMVNSPAAPIAFMKFLLFMVVYKGFSIGFFAFCAVKLHIIFQCGSLPPLFFAYFHRCDIYGSFADGEIVSEYVEYTVIYELLHKFVGCL